MSKMHPKSDAIYDPKTGEILKYSEFLKFQIQKFQSMGIF